MYFPRRYTSSVNGESVTLASATLASAPELETTEAYESIPGDAYETIPGDPIYAQIPERQKQVCYRWISCIVCLTYSPSMNLETTHKLMGFYKEVSLSCFLQGVQG